jgi:predicted nucleic acid-binding protein
MSLMNFLIAATFLQHRMDLVTRNMADFKVDGFCILNLWE